MSKKRLFIGGSGDLVLISQKGPVLLKANSKLIYFGVSKNTIRVSAVRLNDLPLEERYNSKMENTILPFDSIVDEIVLAGDIKLNCNENYNELKIVLSGKSSLHLPTKNHFSKIELKMIENAKFNGHDSVANYFFCSMGNQSKCNSVIVTQRTHLILSGGKCFIQIKKVENSQFQLEMKNGGGKYNINDITQFPSIVPL